MNTSLSKQTLADLVISQEDIVLLPKISSSQGLKEKFTRQEFRKWGMYTKNDDISVAQVEPGDLIQKK